MDFVLDFGNARVKWFDPRNNKFDDFRHAIVQLRDDQWEQVVGRGTPPDGILKVNGIPYAVGDAARRYIIPERPKGASRYTQTYYGVGMCAALADCFQRSTKNITLFASHPPIDIKYARDLSLAAQGKWRVESRQGVMEFEVKNISTFDEPLGGYTHFSFTEKGTEKKKNPLAEVTTLVVDVGGYTVDVAAIDPGGDIDLLSLRSTRAGVIGMMEGFEEQLRAQNAVRFKDTGDIDVRKLEKALMSGNFRFGKFDIDCSTEAITAITALTNDVVQVINSAGGVANFEIILLTGGGSALIADALEVALPTAEIIMAEPNNDLMKFANVFGGAKIAALLRSMDAI